MLFRHIIGGITFEAALDHRVCFIRSEESKAKSFLMKSLKECNFDGLSYTYYNWANCASIDWFSGHLYRKNSIVCFDDADLYIHTLLSHIEDIKATIVVIARSENISVLQKKVQGVLYQVVGNNGFRLQAAPTSCTYCGRVMPLHLLTMDHIIPKNFCDTVIPGATIREHRHNKAWSCFSCNRDKATDILIPAYNASGWMKYMTEEQRGNYSHIFVKLLSSNYEEVLMWIYEHNYRRHRHCNESYTTMRPIIENDIKFFLERYIDRKPGDYWVLI